MSTEFNVRWVNDLFFSHMRELSIRSLKELKDGSRRVELRLVRP